jgi:sec-independent protein translocase protein TatA
VPDLGKPEILILLIVILVLFGARRLPGAARSLGQSLRIFKAETKGLRSEDATPPSVSA